jgi:S1-C subfamily serine protease
MAGGNDSKDCLDIPAVLAGQDGLSTVHSCAGSLFHDTYVNLAPKVAKVEVVTQDGKPDSGTGFFVQDGTHMVTNNHVVEHSSELHINYQGKQYAAVVEKVDDINDLAELKVIGLGADSSRSQKIGPVTLTPNERVLSVGVPGTSGEQKYLNPGVLLRSDRLYRILTDPTVNDAEAARIKAAYDSSDPTVKQMASDRANAPRFIVNQGGRPGESGSPLDDAAGNLVGVVTSVNGNNATIDVPYTKVQDLINSPESTYKINYSTKNEFVMPKLGPALVDTAGVGVEVAGLLGKGRILPVAYAGVRAAALFGEVKDLVGATNDTDKHGLEIKIAQDGAMVAGGALATALWSSPVGRYAGLGLMGLSLASRFVVDSQEKHYVLDSITRKSGDTHKPWED